MRQHPELQVFTHDGNEYDPAWLSGVFHEYQNARPPYNQPAIQASMDMHNNNVGLELGADKNCDCATACDKALSDGKLIYIVTGADGKQRLTGFAKYYMPRQGRGDDRKLPGNEKFCNSRKEKIFTDRTGELKEQCCRRNYSALVELEYP